MGRYIGPVDEVERRAGVDPGLNGMRALNCTTFLPVGGQMVDERYARR